MDLSWLKNFDAESLARSYEQRAQITIADMRRKIENCDTGKLTKDAGRICGIRVSKRSNRLGT